ncbi:hypothetical protein Cni_G07126 [Canna indica]|uniref:Uncharacterized protein n=1 Tax=Canna indica TaxID=4628 RepID=A0AAQ3Q4M5_9LILI|nr:hypothetical protein Cni_G07126 [Canna indica]
MEGLIPLVIRAIKRNRERSSYRCLSRATSAVFESSPLLPVAEEHWKQQQQQQLDRSPSQSRHQRARSELPRAAAAAPSCFGSGCFLPSGGCLGPSQSLRGDSLFR